ncbi:MAG: hypothetical protein FWD82_04130, partial [Defluviitaleaceae bacterium]|nr:hypothetical protein [Defluviitaleaceae bacterium]
HFDRDHHMGIFELITMKNVRTVIIPTIENLKDEYFQTLVELCRIHNTEIVFFSAGSVLETRGGITFEALSPFANNPLASVNENSLVLMLQYQEFRMLFTADVGHPMERILIEQGIDLSAHVLKAGHHGSRHSSSIEFLEAVNPIITFISVGRNNIYGHPTPQAVNNIQSVGSEIFATMDYGAVTLRLRRNGNIRILPMIGD